MTEQEWLACTDPHKMLEFLRSKASERKLRLFMCAYSRWAWPMLVDERSRKGVEVSERYAEGRASEQDLQAAWAAAYSAAQELSQDEEDEAAWAAARASQYLPAREGAQWAGIEGPLWLQWPQDRWQEAVVALLRDIFGNPFRPVAADPASQAQTVLALATAAYDHRDLTSGALAPDRLAVLANALEEAGCDDAFLLGHLRGPGPHVRGCFALDAVLGKS